MKISASTLILILSIWHNGNAKYEPHRIVYQPGAPIQLKFEQFSGYLDGSEDGNKQIFYWLVESQNDPANDPLVLWLNGGPGCSSILGMISENGPFLVDKENPVSLQENIYAWNLVANVLSIESPACVGFSFSRDGNCTVNDDETADQNFNALLSFMEKYPEYRHRDFYITGESYAGVYIPTLAERIVTKNTILRSMLKGVAIGNGLFNEVINVNSLVNFAFSHALLSLDEYEAILEACSCSSETHCDFVARLEESINCSHRFNRTMERLWFTEGFNIYDVSGRCDGEKNPSPPKSRTQFKMDIDLMSLGGRVPMGSLYAALQSEGSDPNDSTEKPDSDMHCYNDPPLYNYMRNPQVYKNLHASRNVAPDWNTCMSIFENSSIYHKQYFDVSQQIKILADNNIQMLFYSGDNDAVCNFMGTELFLQSMPFIKPSSPYEKWLVDDGQIGGWWQSYEPNVQFSTVKGAGHEVPGYKPKESLRLFKAFLANDYK